MASKITKIEIELRYNDENFNDEIIMENILEIMKMLTKYRIENKVVTSNQKLHDW